MVNKFERCVLSVKARQRKSCESNNWKSKGCVNPWAVCTKTVGRPQRKSRKSMRKSRRKSRKSMKKSRK